MCYTQYTSFIKLKSCNQLLTSKKYQQVTDGGKKKKLKLGKNLQSPPWNYVKHNPA